MKPIVWIVLMTLAMSLFAWALISAESSPPTAQEARAPVVQEHKIDQDDDCVGCPTIMMRPNGQIGLGIDLGGGISMSPSGQIGFGF